jgi:hypothetical protein
LCVDDGQKVLDGCQAGKARSAGFMRDFISVVPFFAGKAPAFSKAG